MNKKNKKGFIDFLAGKGFYIILILCIAAIGVSGYMLLFSNKSNPDPLSYLDNPVNSDDAALDRVPMPTLPSASARPQKDDLFASDDIPVAAVTSVAKPTPSATPSALISSPPVVPASETSVKETSSPSPAPTSKPAAPTAFVWPVKGAAVNAFSADDLVYNKTMGDWRVHLGLDIECVLGTQVLAIADGTVKDIYDDVFLGTTVVVEHDGGLVSQYSNLMRSPTVTISEKVSAGQVIGGVGQTAEGERREVNHLHLEMQKDGKPADPMDYLSAD